MPHDAILNGIQRVTDEAVLAALPEDLSPGGNLKVSIEEGSLTVTASGSVSTPDVANGDHIAAITPSDSAQPQVFKTIVCLTAGNCYVKGSAADTAVCIPMVAGQQLLGLNTRYVMTTGPTTGTYAGIY